MGPSTRLAENSQLRDVLCLCLVSGVGPRLRQLLLERFDDSGSVLAAAPSQLREVPGIGPRLAERIAAARDRIDVDAEIALCRQHQVEILLEGDSHFPDRLREIVDPPGVLFVRGQLKAADGLAIGMVGTRHATHYGRTQARRLAGSLARAGLTVVSGMARGIDAAAHRGALEAGGRTIAVLGGGVLNVYPPEHEELATEIAGGGAVLSEMPPRFAPLAGSFPQRNRLLSGLSLGVVIVEAAERSGALITARHAMEQGREVFAVPGPIDSRASRGCHQLLRDGAKLVQSADDVLEELGPLPTPVESADEPAIRHPAELQLNGIEKDVLGTIETAPTQIDRVVAQTGLPVQRVLSTISVLEMRRLVRRISGTQVSRV